MVAANFTQVSFLGGEWSPWAQGRIDHPAYRTAMNVCSNSFPVESGPWTRRPGFVDLGITHRARRGVIRSFTASTTQGKEITFGGVQSLGVASVTYLVEITGASGAEGRIRFWIPQPDGYPTLLCETSPPLITSFSGATPTVMTVNAAQTWATGDTILIRVNSGGVTNAANLAGRQFVLTKLTTTTFELGDAVGGTAIVGSTIAYTTLTAAAKKIVVLDTQSYIPIAGKMDVRLLQSGSYALLLAAGVPVQLMTFLPNFVVSVADAGFKEADGPYLDPLRGTSQTKNKTATATTSDGLTYHITIGSDGEAFSFAASDVGRCFRVWTQPAAWAAGTYTTNDMVTYNNTYWTCRAAGTTVAPGLPQVVAGVQTFPWSLTPKIARWTSAYISAFTDADEIDIRVSFNEVASALLRLTIDAWQIGLYIPLATVGSPTLGNPAPICGGWRGGRLWLGGAGINRFDASMANRFEDFVARRYPLFSPTATDGSIADDLALAETIQAEDSNEIVWMLPDRQGMIMGTGNGQWLVSASTQADTITPTNKQADQVNRHKSAFIEPIRVGNVMVVVQGGGIQVYEYLVDGMSSRFRARPLNEFAEHLPNEHEGILEVCYQEDPTPVLWACTYDGSLLGCTYRRTSDFVTVAPDFAAWHLHDHGAGRTFISVCVGTVANGQSSVAAITHDDDTLFRVEIMSQQWGAV